MANFTLNYTGLRISDAIAGILTTSLSAYNAATAGTFVPITLAEYNALAIGLAGVAKTNATDATLTTNGVAISASNHSIRNTSFNSSGVAMIAGYTFAAKIGILNTSGVAFANGTSITNLGYQIGYGTTASNAGVALSNLSTSPVTVANLGNTSYIHYVVKGASLVNPAGAFPTVRYPASWHSAMTQTNVTGVNQSYLNGATDVTQAPAPTWSGSFMMLAQFLQTPIKQW